MSIETLKDCTKKELARKAKDQGVVGWHAMRKDQLIRALTAPPTAARREARRGVEPPAPPPAHPAQSPLRRLAPTAPARTTDPQVTKDRIVAMVRDPYWLHAYWELSRGTLDRAQAAMGQDWHTAQPILRVLDVTSDETTSATERFVRDIPIHGGVNNWYIDVNNPPRSYRVDIGYLSRRGKFFVLARSNVVGTPKVGVSDLLEQHWASVNELFQRQFGSGSGSGSPRDLIDLLDQRHKQQVAPLNYQTLGSAGLPAIGRKFRFELEAELVVFGRTEPHAHLTMQGEPVPLKSDGTFSVRFSLPDSRQIIPAVSTSPDGVEERTIVLAVERNTKELEPMIHDSSEI